MNSKANSTSTPPAASAGSWSAAFATAAATDVGMRRAANQDSYCITLAEDRDRWEKSGHLLIVADGMGAHAAGELASRLSVDLVPHHFAKLNRGDPIRAILQAMEEANAEIYRRGQANPEFRSMGTTTSSLLFLPIGAVVAHVGDSRVYRLRGHTLEQLTFDHSLVWEMRASGEISEEALKNNVVPKNVITRSLGPNASVQVDLEGPFPVQQGDRYLLCSDGLSGQLVDEEIGILLGSLDITTAVRAMIDLANISGGPDNITVLVAEVVDKTIVSQEDSPAPKERGNAVYPTTFGVIALICGLASIILLLVSKFPLAAISAAAAAVAGISGWLKMQSMIVPRDSSSSLGRGPYRKAQCKPSITFINRLISMIEQLQEYVEEKKVNVDRKVLDSELSQGKEAVNAKNYKKAIGHYCEVLHVLMRDVRTNSESKDDEEIDY